LLGIVLVESYLQVGGEVVDDDIVPGICGQGAPVVGLPCHGQHVLAWDDLPLPVLGRFQLDAVVAYAVRVHVFGRVGRGRAFGKVEGIDFEGEVDVLHVGAGGYVAVPLRVDPDDLTVFQFFPQKGLYGMGKPS